MEKRIVFEGLKDLTLMISIGNRHFQGIRSAIALAYIKQNTIEYKLSRPAYTSKLLTGLLKEEHEERTFSNGSGIMIGTPTMMVSPKVWGELLKL
jgi:hypothetical protein